MNLIFLEGYASVLNETITSINKLKSVWNHVWQYLYPQKQDWSVDLPNEIWMEIMVRLKPYDLLQFSMASQKMQTLALDDHIWRQLAHRKGLLVQPHFSPLNEFKLLFYPGLRKEDSLIKYKFAKAIGPSKFKNLVELWEKGNLKGKEAAYMPFSYVNFGKSVLKIKCIEKISKQQFEMKIIESKEAGRVLVYYTHLPKLIDKKLDVKKIHSTLDLNSSLCAYLTRLAKGEACGLFLNGKEVSEVLLQLASGGVFCELEKF